MNSETSRFSATQTENGFRVTYFDSLEEVNVSVKDLNEFANKYAHEMLEGRIEKLNEKEKLMFSIWEMVLIPDDIKH